MTKTDDKLKLEGVYSQGYGVIPKLVMKDKELTIEAKSIYSYLCSYAGAGDTAFPLVSLICSDLGISKDRYYKHRQLLIDKGYISISQQRESGGWGRNIYTLHSVIEQCPENKETANQDKENQYTQNQCPQNQYTRNKYTNNNNLNNNNLNNNNLNTMSSSGEHDNVAINAEKEKMKQLVNSVIDYLNVKAVKRYRPNSKRTISLINARARDGFVLQDFEHVINVKVAEWKNTDMEQYLRPETLFGNKFESYLNQPEKKNQSKNSHQRQAKSSVTDFGISEVSQRQQIEMMYFNSVNVRRRQKEAYRRLSVKEQDKELEKWMQSQEI